MALLTASQFDQAFRDYLTSIGNPPSATTDLSAIYNQYLTSPEQFANITDYYEQQNPTETTTTVTPTADKPLAGDHTRDTRLSSGTATTPDPTDLGIQVSPQYPELYLSPDEQVGISLPMAYPDYGYNVSDLNEIISNQATADFNNDLITKYDMQALQDLSDYQAAQATGAQLLDIVDNPVDAAGNPIDYQTDWSVYGDINTMVSPDQYPSYGEVYATGVDVPITYNTDPLTGETTYTDSGLYQDPGTALPAPVDTGVLATAAGDAGVSGAGDLTQVVAPTPEPGALDTILGSGIASSTVGLPIKTSLSGMYDAAGNLIEGAVDATKAAGSWLSDAIEGVTDYINPDMDPNSGVVNTDLSAINYDALGGLNTDVDFNSPGLTTGGTTTSPTGTETYTSNPQGVTTGNTDGTSAVDVTTGLTDETQNAITNPNNPANEGGTTVPDENGQITWDDLMSNFPLWDVLDPVAYPDMPSAEGIFSGVETPGYVNWDPVSYATPDASMLMPQEGWFDSLDPSVMAGIRAPYEEQAKQLMETLNSIGSLGAQGAGVSGQGAAGLGKYWADATNDIGLQAWNMVSPAYLEDYTAQLNRNIYDANNLNQLNQDEANRLNELADTQYQQRLKEAGLDFQNLINTNLANYATANSYRDEINAQARYPYEIFNSLLAGGTGDTIISNPTSTMDDIAAILGNGLAIYGANSDADWASIWGGSL